MSQYSGKVLRIVILFCRLHASGNWWVSPRFLHQWTENQGWSHYSCPHSNVPDFRTRRNMRWFFRSRLGSHLWQAALVKWCCRSNFYGSRYIFWIWYHHYDSVFSLDNSLILELFFSKYLVKMNKKAPEEVILPHLWACSQKQARKAFCQAMTVTSQTAIKNPV